ncbi:MAG: DUF4270 domain-containing protein [Bacteroidia bacterium]|nr:DUF4270 domain-containing protein [Bacteroidia bacterium]
MRSTKNIFKIFSYALIVCLSSCDKEDKIGGEVHPSGVNLDLKLDTTISVNAFTIREDSLRTDELSRNVAGSYNDPVFGQTTASIYTQFRLTSSNVTFGENPILDSIVLVLDYTGFYGDASASMNIEVYEVTEDFYKDSTYYSNKKLSFDVTEDGKKTFIPSLLDEEKVDGNNTEKHLRIKLNNSLGQKLLNESGSSNLADNEAFLAFFKGLHITSTSKFASGYGVVLYLDLESSASNLTLYYSNDSVSNSFDFVINDKSARFNHFEHDYSGTDVNGQLSDSTLGDNNLYVQATSGVKIKLLIPDLTDTYKNDKVAFNKAEIIINIEEGSNDDYEELNSIILVSVGEDGQKMKTIAVGGYNSNDKNYTFNITNYIQNYIQDDFEDYGFYLLAGGGSTLANRSILKGDKDIKLNLIFTELN